MSAPSSFSDSSDTAATAAAPDLNLGDRLGLHGPAAAATVVGLQWGDEGKGKVVDLLTAEFDVVARYNGGANAGHSVQVGDERYALHLIPSGILYREKLNVLGNGVVIDPAVLLTEIADMRARGVHVGGDNLKVAERAHVVLPYHKLQDHLMDRALGQAMGDQNKIGTTGRGIGPCYADKALRSTAIRMGDLLRPDTLRQKLEHIVFLKNKMLGSLASSCDQPFSLFDAQQLASEFSGYGQALREHICDTTRLLHEAVAAKRRILFEGANATLLDIDHGTFPFVTSSNCSALGVHTGTGIPPAKVGPIVGIMKAYSTRVGGGPMPTELVDETGDLIRQTGREFGTTTGRPRRCGWLDLVAVRYSAAVSGATCLAVMLLDVLSVLDTLKICVAYTHKGQRIEHFPTDCDTLNEVEQVYETLDGWRQPITECRQYDDLPDAAKRYIERIEQHVGVPVKMISVGPRRDQTILR